MRHTIYQQFKDLAQAEIALNSRANLALQLGETFQYLVRLPV